MFLNNILYLSSFATSVLKILFRLVQYIYILLFRSGTLQVLMIDCYTLRELRFFECYHPFYLNITLCVCSRNIFS